MATLRKIRGSAKDLTKEETPPKIGDLVDYKVQFNFEKLYEFLAGIIKNGEETAIDLKNIRHAFFQYREENDLSGHIAESNEKFMQMNLTQANFQEKMMNIDLDLAQNKTRRDDWEIKALEKIDKLEALVASMQDKFTSMDSESKEKQKQEQHRISEAKLMDAALRDTIEKKEDESEEEYDELAEARDEQRREEEELKKQQELVGTQETTDEMIRLNKHILENEQKLFKLEASLGGEMSKIKKRLLSMQKGSGQEDSGFKYKEDASTFEEQKMEELTRELANQPITITGSAPPNIAQIENNIITLSYRFEQTESIVDKLASFADEETAKMDLVFENMKSLQEQLKEKMELNLNFDLENETPALPSAIREEHIIQPILPETSAQVVLGDKDKDSVIRPEPMEIIAKKEDKKTESPIKRKVGGFKNQLKINKDQIDPRTVAAASSPQNIQMNKLASKDDIVMIDQTVKMLEKMLSLKPNKKDLDALEQRLLKELAKTDKNIGSLTDFRGSANEVLKEIRKAIPNLQKNAQDTDAKMKQLEEYIRKVDFSAQDLSELMDKTATATDLDQLRMAMESSSQSLKQLFQILEDDDTLDLPGKKGKTGVKGGRQNIKLAIMRLEDRIGMLEKRQELETFGEIGDSIEHKQSTEDDRRDSTVVSLPGTSLKPGDRKNIQIVMAKQEGLISLIQTKVGRMEVLQGENDNHLKRIYTDLKKTMEDMVNETTKALTNVIESLREKLQIKVDFASLNSMKEKMDKGIFQQIEKKIDKIELRRAQTKLRKQLEALENKILNHPQDKTRQDIDSMPLMLVNSKCYFCNQEVRLSADMMHMLAEKYNTKDELTGTTASRNLVIKGRSSMTTKAPKFGAGFSKVLSSLKSPAEYEHLFPSGQATESLQTLPSVDDRVKRGIKSSTRKARMISEGQKLSEGRGVAVKKEIILPNAVRIVNSTSLKSLQKIT